MKEVAMPTIAAFLGLVIKMYFQQREHNPPHIHVEYGEDAAAVSIATGAVLDGTLPVRAQRLLRPWIERYREELCVMWDTQAFHKLPPLS